MRQTHQNFQNHRTGLFRRFLPCFLLLLPALAAHAQGPAPTRTSLTAQVASSGTSTGTVLKSTVQTATGSAVGGGTVDFVLAGGQSFGSAIVHPDGTATLAVPKLPAGTTNGVDGTGTLPVTAVYHATAEASAFADSASVATAIASPQVTTAAPDFTLTGKPTTVTTARGSYGVTAITVSSVGNYSGAIQFSCSNLPAQVTCAFNPTQQTLAANGSFVSTLELQTQSPSGTASSSLLPAHSDVALAMLIPGALILLGFSGRRRRALRGVQLLGVAMLLAGTGLGLSGCSQRYNYLHHPPPVSGGTPIGTFPITVAVDGNQGASVIEHDITVSLVVQ
jgi:hypothetical protein